MMPDLKTVTFDANQYQLVPKEPTEAMRYAASLTDDITNDGIYAAMLAAAPTPAAQVAAPNFDARQWQPIDTAPKDGTEVLLIATRHSMLLPHPEMLVGAYRRGWWSGPSTLSHVTHWMPLPAAPGAAPSPAAQSAGQEAERCARLAELYRDEHASGRCCEETCNEIAKACREYAAPVNGGEREQAVDAAGRILIDAAARSGDEGAITLALQLAGAAPCDACGFVNYKCRCDRAADAQQVDAETTRDPFGCLNCTHAVCVRYIDGSRYLCHAMRDNACARDYALTSPAKEQK